MIQNTNYGASKTYVDTALADKVDKLTTTGTKAYTHDGVTQGEISLEDGQTANTIPIKDANGRMHAADPESGATDKTLTTANWVSQTGNNAPNNLVHKTGNESISGIKLGTNIQSGVGATISGATSGTDWVRLGYMTVINNAHPLVVLMVTCRQITVGGRQDMYGILAFGASSTGSVKPPRWLIAGSGVNPDYFKLALKADPVLGYIAELWCRVPGTNNVSWTCSALLMDHEFQAWHGIIYEAPVAEPDWTSYVSTATSTIQHIQ